jgi:hypothetical protein
MMRLVARVERASLPLPDGEFAALMKFAYPEMVFTNEVSTLLAESRALGVLEETHVVFTNAARALRRSSDQLMQACTGGERSFVVQADHSVIAPPDLDAELVQQLNAFATLESDAGALVFRGAARTQDHCIFA